MAKKQRENRSLHRNEKHGYANTDGRRVTPTRDRFLVTQGNQVPNARHLHFVNLVPESKIHRVCCEKNDGFDQYLVTFDERGVQDLFEPSEVGLVSSDRSSLLYNVPQVLQNPQGHSCKIGNMRPPGTLENQNPQFEKIFKFGLLFMWSYHIQWGKNAGPPCLTHRPFSGDFF